MDLELFDVESQETIIELLVQGEIAIVFDQSGPGQVFTVTGTMMENDETVNPIKGNPLQ